MKTRIKIIAGSLVGLVLATLAKTVKALDSGGAEPLYGVNGYGLEDQTILEKIISFLIWPISPIITIVALIIGIVIYQKKRSKKKKASTENQMNPPLN